MAFFGVSPRERADALGGVLSEPADTTALARDQAPGFFAGSQSDALQAGAATAGMRVLSFANAMAKARTTQARMMTSPFGYNEAVTQALDEQDKAFSEQQTELGKAIADIRPDPKTTGMASQIIFGATDMLATIAASGGNPLLAGGVYGGSQVNVNEAEGLDPSTARAKALIEGITTGLAVKLPASLTGSLAMRAASGAGLNVAIGVPQRGLISSLLRERGYDEMAQQYEPLDASAIATEAILGAVFGAGFGGRGEPTYIPPSVVDAALVARQQIHAEIDSAPGIPIDTASRQAHIAALNEATRGLLTGEDFDVEPILREAGFIPKPEEGAPDVRGIIEQALRDEGTPEALHALRGLEEEATARGLEVEPNDLPAIPLKTPEEAERATSYPGAKGQLERADEAVAQAKESETAFLTAVECFLGGGK